MTTYCIRFMFEVKYKLLKLNITLRKNEDDLGLCCIKLTNQIKYLYVWPLADLLLYNFQLKRLRTFKK